MHARLLLPTLTALSIALMGCESGDPSVSRINSFGDGTESDIRNDGSGLRCKNTRNLDDNQLLVSVQTPGDTPDAEPDRGLTNTTDATLRVESTRDGTRYEFNSRTAGEDLVLTFPDGIPDGVEVIITASVGGDRYRAPIASSCGHAFVNPFSERLVETIVTDLSDGEIASINDCTTSDCPYLLRWEPLVDQVQTFEINAATLPDRADFAAFLERSRELLTQTPANFVSNDNGQINLAFNTVQFGVSLTHNRSDNTAFWASHTIDRGQSTANGGTGFAYPLLTLNGINLSTGDDAFTDDFLNFDFSAARIDVPFERNSGTASPLDSVFSSYSTNSNRLYRRTNNNLMSLRRLLQTVDDTSDGRTVGWAPNPHLFEAGVSGPEAGESRFDAEDPRALLGGYFHGARGIELTGNSGDGFERDQVLEEQAIAGIELDLAEWAPSQSFTADDNYWFAGFELKAGNANSFGLARASLGAWDNMAVNGSGTENVPADGAVWELHSNGTVSDTTDPTPYGGFQINESAQKQSANDTGDFLGNLYLNYDNANLEGGNDVPNGAASPDGYWLAFSGRSQSADDDAGDILRLARTRNVSPSPVSGTPYRLKGFSIEVSGNGKHRLTQRASACMTLDAGNADIRLEGHRTQYSTDSGEYRIADAEQSSTSCTYSQNNLFSIDSCSSSHFQARGYAADGGDTLVMITRTDQSVGFLLGFKDDSAEGCSG